MPGINKNLKDDFFNSINLKIKDIFIVNGLISIGLLLYGAIYIIVRKIFGSRIIAEYPDVISYIFSILIIKFIYNWKLKDLRFFGLNQIQLKKNIKFVFALVFFIYFTKICTQLISKKYFILENDINHAFQPVSLILLHSLLIVLIGPIIQEIIFRGFFYPPLRKKFGVTWAYIISALIFTIWHFGMDIKGLLNIFFIGILLAYVYERSLSLIPAIIAHIIINATSQITILYRFSENKEKTFLQPKEFFLYMASFYFIVSFIFFISYKREKRKEIIT